VLSTKMLQSAVVAKRYIFSNRLNSQRLLHCCSLEGIELHSSIQMCDVTL